MIPIGKHESGEGEDHTNNKKGGLRNRAEKQMGEM